MFLGGGDTSDTESPQLGPYLKFPPEALPSNDAFTLDGNAAEQRRRLCPCCCASRCGAPCCPSESEGEPQPGDSEEARELARQKRLARERRRRERCCGGWCCCRRTTTLVALVAVGALLLLVGLAYVVQIFIVERTDSHLHCLQPSTRAAAARIFNETVLPWRAQHLPASLPPRLALAYALHPVVIHHPRERFLPVSMEDYMSQAYLWAETADSFIYVHIGDGYANSSLLSSAVRDPSIFSSRMLLFNAQPFGGTPPDQLSRADMYVDVRVACVQPEHGPPPLPLEPPCDVVLRSAGGDARAGAKFWELRFVFLSLYNGPFTLFGFLHLGEHRGDLEHITVRADITTGNVTSVYYSAHQFHQGNWYAPEQLDWFDDGRGGRHPVVYSALDSHACYPACGTVSRNRDAAWLPHDFTSEAGALWLPQQLVPLMNDSLYEPFNGDNLMWRYTGDWGSPMVRGVQRQPWWMEEA
jgi:hypothetical protein